MRVALEGYDEATEFYAINGVWLSEDCEPVEVEFAWERPSEPPAVAEPDCICPPEVAARLIRLLFSGENVPKPVLVQRAAASGGYQVS
jgi:hypothetical protein